MSLLATSDLGKACHMVKFDFHCGGVLVVPTCCVPLYIWVDFIQPVSANEHVISLHVNGVSFKFEQLRYSMVVGNMDVELLASETMDLGSINEGRWQ